MHYLKKTELWEDKVCNHFLCLIKTENGKFWREIQTWASDTNSKNIFFKNIRMEHYFIIINSSNIYQALPHKNFNKFLKNKKVIAILRFDM